MNEEINQGFFHSRIVPLVPFTAIKLTIETLDRYAQVTIVSTVHQGFQPKGRKAKSLNNCLTSSQIWRDYFSFELLVRMN